MNTSASPVDPASPYGDAIQNQQSPTDGPHRAGSYYSDEGRPHELDANAPSLKAHELQRMNRKALVFLAGILVLLVAMIAWLLDGATSTERVSRPREETVVIPELPRGPAASPNTLARPAARAIPVADYEQSPLPPLPPVDPAPGYGQPFERQVARPPPTLVERRMANAAGAGAGGEGDQSDPYVQAMLAGLPTAAPGAAPVHRAEAANDATNARYISRPDALLVRGTYIRCVLETRIVTDVAGFTSCIVTEPTYSINGRTLLLPRGSKLLGRYGLDEVSRERVAVIWDRLTTPDGVDVAMSSPGVDQLGGAGHPGDRNEHWGSRVGSALLVSLISDAFKYAGQKNGPTSTTTYGNGFVAEQPFESNTARALEGLADQAVRDSAGRRATVTINQGTVVNVYVSRDIDFSQVMAGR
jgi:type IV secretion system protein VirB10